MANKLRHIAISVRDPDKAAKFFEEAFGMTRAGNAQRGIYMTDGIFNVALLKKEADNEKLGPILEERRLTDLGQRRVVSQHPARARQPEQLVTYLAQGQA